MSPSPFFNNKDIAWFWIEETLLFISFLHVGSFRVCVSICVLGRGAEEIPPNKLNSLDMQKVVFIMVPIM